MFFTGSALKVLSLDLVPPKGEKWLVQPMFGTTLTSSKKFQTCLFVSGPMLKERFCCRIRSRGLTLPRSMLKMLLGNHQHFVSLTGSSSSGGQPALGDRSTLPHLTDDNLWLDCWRSLGSKEQSKTCGREDLLPEKEWRRWPTKRWLKKCQHNWMRRARREMMSPAPQNEETFLTFRPFS